MSEKRTSDIPEFVVVFKKQNTSPGAWQQGYCMFYEKDDIGPMLRMIHVSSEYRIFRIAKEEFIHV